MKAEIIFLNFSYKNYNLFKPYIYENICKTLRINFTKLNAEILKNNNLAVIVIDYSKPNYNLREALNHLKHLNLHNIPVIIYSEKKNLNKKNLDYAQDLLYMPFDEHIFMAKIANLLKNHLKLKKIEDTLEYIPVDFNHLEEISDSRILIISNELAIIEEIKGYIQPIIGFIESAIFKNYYDHFLQDYVYSFDLIIIDGVNNIHELIFLYSQIKAHEDLNEANIILIKKNTDLIFSADIINLGINDFVEFPIHIDTLLNQVKLELKNKKYFVILENALEQAVDLSLIDETSGLFNKKYLMNYFNKININGVFNKKIALIIFDVDNFKNINDEYGHACGDFIIKEIALILKRNIKNNILIRFGGDEFIIIVENIKFINRSDITNIINIISNLEKIFGERHYHYNQQLLKVETSFGFAINHIHESTTNFFARADKELYRAKHRKAT